MNYAPLPAILTHRITFIENINDNELTEPVWQEKYTTFAQIKPLYDNKFGSIEKLTFGHLVTEAFFMVKIRFTEVVTIKMRINFNGRMFEIKRIMNLVEKRKITQMICLELS